MITLTSYKFNSIHSLLFLHEQPLLLTSFSIVLFSINIKKSIFLLFVYHHHLLTSLFLCYSSISLPCIPVIIGIRRRNLHQFNSVFLLIYYQFKTIFELREKKTRNSKNFNKDLNNTHIDLSSFFVHHLFKSIHQ